jgi:hypothetical protein
MRHRRAINSVRNCAQSAKRERFQPGRFHSDLDRAGAAEIRRRRR